MIRYRHAHTALYKLMCRVEVLGVHDVKMWIFIMTFRAGVDRPYVETKLTATEKSSTDGDWSVTTLCWHKRAYDRIQLVADRKYPIAEIHPCTRTVT